ncbi:MAG: hypothetical protein ACJ797_09075 [Ktedonobacteraceae bacterium]
MVNTAYTQSSQSVFERRYVSANGQQPRSGVGQDNPTPNRARTASPQPAPRKRAMRPQAMNTSPARSQNTPTAKRKTVHLTLWVKPVVKSELERIAESEGVSVSKAGGALLEQAIQQNVDMQYSALLQPIIEQAIAKQMRSYSSRIAMLLVRVAFASEQTRGIVTNILGRQPGVTPDVLTTILDGSSNTAKGNITRNSLNSWKPWNTGYVQQRRRGRHMRNGNYQSHLHKKQWGSESIHPVYRTPTRQRQ